MASKDKNYRIDAYLKAGRPGSKERIHEAFANLSDDPDAIREFLQRWGKFLSGNDTVKGIIHYRDLLRTAWKGDKKALDSLPLAMFATFGVNRGKLEIAPRTAWSLINVLFLRDRLKRKTAICANQGCPTPYFIRKRKTQKYCEAGPCLAEAQRQQKREWWTRNHGKGEK